MYLHVSVIAFYDIYTCVSGCQPRIQLIVHCKNIIVKITILLFSTVAKNLIVSCMIVQIIMYTCMLMPYLFAVIITNQ